jgi:hypothetical protein
MSKKPVKEAIQSLVKKDLPVMKEKFNAALTQKAAAKLEEMKTEIGSAFFRK